MQNRIILLFFIAFLVFYSISIGHRPVQTYTDFEAYNLWFERISVSLDFNGRLEPLFQILGLVFAFFSFSPEQFFTFLYFSFSILVITAFYLLIESVTMEDSRKNNVIYITLFLSIIISYSLPFYYNASTNVLRAGLSFPFVVISMKFISERKFKKAIFFGLCSIGFHYSSLMFLVFFTVYNQFDRKFLSWSFWIGVLLYSISATKVILLSLGLSFIIKIVEQVDNFVSFTGYESGYRKDFLCFTVFILLSHKMANKIIKVEVKNSNLLEDIYKSLSLPFLIVGFGSFSDRYLLNSWLFAPLLLSVPCANFFKKSSSLSVYLGLGLSVFLCIKMFIYYS